MTQIALEVLKYGEQLETLLAEELSAVGKGLGEKLISVEHKLPDSLVREMKRIVRERNEAAHHPSTYSIVDPEAFYRSCERAVADLKQAIARINAPPPPAQPLSLDSVAPRPQSPAPGVPGRPVMQVASLALALVVGVILGRSVFSAHASSGDAPPEVVSSAALPASTVAASIERQTMTSLAAPPAPSEKANTHMGEQHRLVAPKGTSGGLHASAIQSAFVSISDTSLRRSSDSFGTPILVIDATLTNLSSKYLASIDTEVKVYVPQDKRWITGIRPAVYFGPGGLAPRQSTREQIPLDGFNGPSDGASYDLEVPDVVNARSLTAILSIQSATDGIGDKIDANGAVASTDPTAVN